MKTLSLIAAAALFAGALPASASADPHAFPVPFVAREHGETIWFTDLPASGTIRILTVEGDQVVALPIGPGENIKPWNVRNEDGKKVGTGVYLFFVDSSDGSTAGKIVVIR